MVGEIYPRGFYYIVLSLLGFSEFFHRIGKYTVLCFNGFNISNPCFKQYEMNNVFSKSLKMNPAHFV